MRRTNLGRWLALVSETYTNPGVRATAYEIAAGLGRGVHPTDDELARRVGVGRDTVISYRQTLRRDGFLTWEQGVGRGNSNTYALLKAFHKVSDPGVGRKIRI